MQRSVRHQEAATGLHDGPWTWLLRRVLNLPDHKLHRVPTSKCRFRYINGCSTCHSISCKRSNSLSLQRSKKRSVYFSTCAWGFGIGWTFGGSFPPQSLHRTLEAHSPRRTPSRCPLGSAGGSPSRASSGGSDTSKLINWNLNISSWCTVKEHC